MKLADTLRSDFERTSYWASRWTLAIWRSGQWLRRHERRWWRPFAIRLCKVADLVWIQTLMGSELPWSVECGPGINLHHGGRGVILHRHVAIGAGVTLYHHTTIGVRNGDVPPTIGDSVYIGAGAAIIGPISVGDGARIGAGAVVLRNVPARASAVGVPARLIVDSSRDEESSDLSWVEGQ